MKIYLMSLSFLLISTFMLGQSKIKPDDIVGEWVSNLGKSQVEVFKENGKYVGKILWLKNPAYADGTLKIDKNNPDTLLQSRPLVGMYFLKDLEFVKDHWENGTIYDPESGNTYSCIIRLKDGKLDLRGYLGVSQLGRTQTWTKAETSKK